MDLQLLLGQATVVRFGGESQWQQTVILLQLCPLWIKDLSETTTKKKKRRRKRTEERGEEGREKEMKEWKEGEMADRLEETMKEFFYSLKVGKAFLHMTLT